MHSYEIIKRQHENMRIFFASLSSQMAFKFLDRATSESFIRSANVQAKKVLEMLLKRSFVKNCNN